MHDYWWSPVLEVLQIPGRAAAGLEVCFFVVHQNPSLTECREPFKKNIFVPGLYSVPYFTKIFYLRKNYLHSCMWIQPAIYSTLAWTSQLIFTFIWTWLCNFHSLGGLILIFFLILAVWKFCYLFQDEDQVTIYVLSSIWTVLNYDQNQVLIRIHFIRICSFWSKVSNNDIKMFKIWRKLYWSFIALCRVFQFILTIN